MTTDPETRKLYNRIEARAGRRLTPEELQRRAERSPRTSSPASGAGPIEVLGYTMPPKYETVTVQAAPTLVARMQNTWSPPVQVMLTYGPNGWEMTFRTHDCPGQQDPTDRKV